MPRDVRFTNRNQVRRGMLVFVLLALALVAIPSSISAQATDDVVWETYDVTIDVQADGTMHVTERQLVRFDGSFSSGFAVIPLNRVEDIENVEVAVADSAAAEPEPLDYLRSSRYDGDPGTYTYSSSAGELSIDYGFTETDYFGTEQRLIVLEYDVLGGIRVYEDLEPANQQVWWYAISQDVTDIARVESATVTVNLPEQVPADQTIAFPENPTVTGASYVWTASDLGEGDEFEVRLQFPPITAATVPEWQERDDQIRQDQEEAEERSAFAGTIMLAAGLLLLFGGGVAVYGLWFSAGRDPDVGKIAEYITEPPDDLRPGAAGTLIDERAQTRDIVATVIDLARRGVLRMDTASDTPGAATIGSEFELLDHDEVLEPYEQTVLDAIFQDGAAVGAKAKLPTIQGSFAREAEDMYRGYYAELVAHGYFKEAPDVTRTRWQRIFRTIPWLVFAAVVVTLIIVQGMTLWIIFPIAIGLLLMVFARRLADTMPAKTVAGAESAAKWRAFRTYLEQIEERADLSQSREIFDRFLPYAVAFGLQDAWVSKFAYVQVPVPQWFGSTPGPLGSDPWSGGRRYRRSGHPGRTAWGAGGGSIFGETEDADRPGGGFNIPTLQGGSDAAGRGLQGASNDFFGMLGTVAKAFAESSGSGSGSWGSSGSRGSFSGGGSRGGGSRSRGGGGGGGRRGFR